MKKILLLAFVVLSFGAIKAQTVSIASELDSMQNPIYGDVFLFDAVESTPFYIIVDDIKPVTCNKMKVKAYFRDYVNGSSDDDYWVYQGEFEYPITPDYYGYWMEMNAFSIGEYKVEVFGYLNNTYQRYFGSSEITVYSEDDYWDYGWW
ncbi:MAG: hypothetical protein F9K23_16135 [Bacteroidetes bacterium]|nr:MAG: hypothetical protein F9K23_16135 [Bacteroidota bacterium]